MKVYAVYQQSDMTEGRGPMVLDSLWWTEDGAWAYANRELGVMGRSGYRNHADIRNKVDQKYKDKWLGKCYGWQCKACWPYGGDWQVKAIEVN